MIQSVFFLVVGLGVLLFAGELLVRGASGLARLANIPALVVGLTVVAFGTSAPELVVTVQAVADGAAGIAMGNIVGSNIANILLVLGMPAVLAPIALNVERLKRHGLALAGATTLFCALVYRSGGVGLLEASLFTLGMLGYFALMLNEARKGESDLTAEAAELAPTKPRFPPTMLMLIAGLVGLPVGATLLVDNGRELASMLGVRDEIIGLTVVAFGTSLPELATVLAAAARKEMGVVAGSIIGSNIFNMLFVGSAAGFVAQSSFTPTALQIDLPMMIAATVLITALIMTKTNIGRLTGVAMTSVYVGYIIFLGVAGIA